MKITILSPTPNLSGGHRVKAIYAERLQARGHDVTIVAPRLRQRTFAQNARLLLKGKMPQRLSDASHYDGMKAGLKLIDHGGPITADDLPDADVVIATWWQTAFMVAHLPASKGRKFYFVQGHETHHPANRHISAGTYYLPMQKIVIAGWLKDVMANTYNDPNAILVPNSVDQSLFFAPPRTRQKRPTIGLMYSPHPAKGLDVALHALRKATAQIPDLQVIAFGKSPPISAHPLPANATFHLRPSQDHLRNIYASCDAFLFSSRHEGFGLPVLEAMACRTPVVGTRTGCAPDAIEDGVSGYLADIDDADGLAHGLTRVLSASDTNWQAMSAAAHGYVQQYDWDAATDLFEKALIAP